MIIINIIIVITMNVTVFCFCCTKYNICGSKFSSNLRHSGKSNRRLIVRFVKKILVTSFHSTICFYPLCSNFIGLLYSSNQKIFYYYFVLFIRMYQFSEISNQSRNMAKILAAWKIIFLNKIDVSNSQKIGVSKFPFETILIFFISFCNQNCIQLLKIDPP